MGAVLTGGASRRMGRTKALIEIDGVPMAARVATALRDAGCASVLLFGGDPDQLASLGHPVVPDVYPGRGPLGGILGVLRTLEGSDVTQVAIVACDLPELRGDDLGPLFVAAADDDGADVIVATTGRIEPTCAIWRSTARDRLQHRFDAGERAIHRALADLVVVEIPIDARAVRNINTPDDLDRYP